jgi:glycosyltransferase involved in cell wall biosynthesis
LNNRIRAGHRSTLELVFENASRIIVVGTALRSAISEWTNKPLVQLPNPIDQNLFFHDPESSKPSTFTVIAIGSLIPRKRIDVLLKAIALCPDVKLMIIGSGVEEEKLKQLARSLELAPRTTWTRFMSSAELAKVFRSAHLLVSASDTETFGIVVAEAMMCGLPVICTASGGPEEFVDEKQGIILERLASPEELARAIRNIQTDYAQYHADDIATYAKEQFSRQVVIPKILGHYQEILNQ